MAHTDLDTSVDDGWPWNCARCESTIYHDAVHCKACRQQEGGFRDSPMYPAGRVPLIGPLIEWIEAQSYPSLVAKSSTIAGIELLLTALWIRLLYLGVPVLPVGVPI